MTAKRRYAALIEHVFFRHFSPGIRSFEFARKELLAAAEALGMPAPKNVGDVIYSVRYRMRMPKRIASTAPDGEEWRIEGSGRASYRFVLGGTNRIQPNPQLLRTKLPDATPELIGAYSLSDEQALLAIVRYNRLLDIFLGMACYSLQSHLRTTVQGVGQVEIDEVYLGVDKFGVQYVIPVQAKGGADRLSVVQARQDVDCCGEKFPALVCRPVSAQFLAEDLVVLFELAVQDGELRVAEERHYQLVPQREISSQDLQEYSNRAIRGTS